ncbi:MAG: hypothetical protein M1818_008230 [Claussenomyces sp. TS43310]|nr:MAG: hypothetical protein M1818_008230 [Claussenomyces sp. TS43310]
MVGSTAASIDAYLSNATTFWNSTEVDVYLMLVAVTLAHVDPTNRGDKCRAGIILKPPASPDIAITGGLKAGQVELKLRTKNEHSWISILKYANKQKKLTRGMKKGANKMEDSRWGIYDRTLPRVLG